MQKTCSCLVERCTHGNAVSNQRVHNDRMGRYGRQHPSTEASRFPPLNTSHPTSNIQWPPLGQLLDVGGSMLVVGCYLTRGVHAAHRQPSLSWLCFQSVNVNPLRIRSEGSPDRVEGGTGAPSPSPQTAGYMLPMCWLCAPMNKSEFMGAHSQHSRSSKGEGSRCGSYPSGDHPTGSEGLCARAAPAKLT
jgi:hypothetical protein